MQRAPGPRLVVVSGAPASGKSTLARHLADALALPLLAKDALKEAIADAMGRPWDVPASQRLGEAAYAVQYNVAAGLLDGGIGVVVESNYRRGVAEAELGRLVERASAARLVHCTAHDDLIRSRYDDRRARGERHLAHLDADRRAALAGDLAMGRFDPVDLGCPCLVVDTEDGYRPPLDEITAFAAS